MKNKDGRDIAIERTSDVLDYCQWERRKHISGILASVAREKGQYVDNILQPYMLDVDKAVRVCGYRYPLRTSLIPSNDSDVRQLFEDILNRNDHITCMMTSTSIAWLEGLRRVRGLDGSEFWVETF